MNWPQGWLTILMVLRLHRNGTKWMKQTELVKEFEGIAEETSVYPRLSKLKETDLVERRKGASPHRIRLTKEGIRSVDLFVEQVDKALGAE